jgi:integrase
LTLVKNPRTGNWEADIRSKNGVAPRLHISLRTKRKNDAEESHSAVKALYKQGNAKLILALRKRRITVEAVTRVHLAQQPFETLLQSAVWPTIEKATKDYLRWMEQQTDRSPKTIQSARLLLGKASEYFKGRTLDSISNEEIEDYKSKILERGVTSWTAELELARLRALYGWMATREDRTAQREKRAPRVLHSPVDSEIMQSRSVGRTRFLDTPEAQKVLAATPDSLLFLVAAGLLEGLRLDEVCHLRPPPLDLNFEIAGGVIIVQEKDLASGGLWRPKSKRRREIPMAGELLPIARRHAERYASLNWMCPHPGQPDQPLNKNWLGSHFLQIVKDAGLIAGQGDPMGVTFHTLRHTFASWLVMAGVDLWTVAQLLGHSGIKLVEQTYGHLSPNHKRLAMDRLGTSYNLGLEGVTE